MTEDHIQAFSDLFGLIYKDNEDAISISFKLLETAHTWDDLIDGDEVKPNAINSAFIALGFELQQYEIWHSAGLAHHLLNCYLRWRDATNIERGDHTDSDLHKCYMLRAGLYDLFVIIAYHLYGDEWACDVGPIVRKFYGETLEEYMGEMKNA